MIDNEIRAVIEEQINSALKLFNVEVKKQLDIQGHRNTGRLERSLDYFISDTGLSIIGVAVMEEYGLKLDTGVPASQISLSVNYLNELTQYFRSKGFGADSKKIALRTGLVQKREGMPTRGSYRFSKNGKRTGFVDDSYNNVKDQFEKIITDKLIDKVTFTAINIITNVSI